MSSATQMPDYWAQEFLQLTDAAIDLRDRLEKAKEENAKLRELVRDMWGYAVNREMELCNACSCADGDFADCSACDEYDGACGIAKKRFEELYADRMHELGVDA